MKRNDCPLVVICGASAGVGRATAHAYAAAGYAVGLLARSDEGLAGAVEELQAYGVPTLAISVDVADAAAVAQAAQRCEAELGAIEVWINSAMVTVFAAIEQLTPEEIRRVTEVTYLGAVHGTLAALDLMRTRDRGVIIQVGSALAYRAIPLQSAYCGAKFALRGFTDSLRCELIHQGSKIKVCMVQLPAINTPQFDWARNKLGNRVQPVPPIHDPTVARAPFSASLAHRRGNCGSACQRSRPSSAPSYFRVCSIGFWRAAHGRGSWTKASRNRQTTTCFTPSPVCTRCADASPAVRAGTHWP